MVFLKVILLSLSLIFLTISSYAGEPGTEQTQQIEQDKKVDSQKEPESKRESNELYEIEEEILKTKLQQLKLLKK